MTRSAGCTGRPGSELITLGSSRIDSTCFFRALLHNTPFKQYHAPNMQHRLQPAGWWSDVAWNIITHRTPVSALFDHQMAWNSSNNVYIFVLSFFLRSENSPLEKIILLLQKKYIIVSLRKNCPALWAIPFLMAAANPMDQPRQHTALEKFSRALYENIPHAETTHLASQDWS